MARDQLIPLPWPTSGFIENTSFSEMPPLSTLDALNVRNFDSIDRRNRGGTRTGIGKYIVSTVNGSNGIQSIGAVVLSFDSTTISADVLLVLKDFSDFSDGIITTVDPNEWATFNQIYSATASGNDRPSVISGELRTTAAGTNAQSAAYQPTVALVPGSAYVIKWKGRSELVSANHTISFRLDPTDPVSNNDHLRVDITISGSDLFAKLNKRESGGNAEVTITTGSTTITSLATGGVTADQNYEFQVTGNVFRLLVNDAEAWTASSSVASSQTGFGISVADSSGFEAAVQEMSIFTGVTPATLRTTKLIVVSGGRIHSGNKTNGLTVPTGGSSAQITSGLTAIQDAFQKVYFADGLNYKVFDPKTNIVTNWQDSLNGGALPTGGTGIQFTITAVDTSTKQFTVAEDVSSVFSAGDFLAVILSPDDPDNGDKDNDRTYTVASTSGSGPTVITVDQTPQSSVAGGTLSAGDVGCTILALFAGSMFGTGLETDPQNWFSSKAGDVNNWEYFPAVLSQEQAVAGNNGTSGRLGDVVTALAPYNDDNMIMGGANSIHIMRGHPAAGGRIDLIAQGIGIVGPRAWTYDTGNNFYFFSINGLYRMDLNSFNPVLLSQNRLDKTFADVNVATNHILVVYDPEWQGVHVFISPIDQPDTASRHYFWDERNNAWWPDQYPAAVGPIAIYRFNADNPENSALILGGYDGQLRFFDADALDDDGTAINAFCRFTPLTLGTGIATSRIHDVTVILDKGSGATTYKVYSGDTVEQAEDNADANIVRVKKILKGGRNSPMRHRVSQNTFIFELSQNATGVTFAFEQAFARVAVLNRVRGRGV